MILFFIHIIVFFALLNLKILLLKTLLKLYVYTQCLSENRVPRIMVCHSTFEEKHLFLEKTFFSNAFIHLVHLFFPVLCMILFSNKVKAIYPKINIFLLVAVA